MKEISVYQQYLIDAIISQVATSTPTDILNKLAELGVIDIKRCKVIAVHRYVFECMGMGFIKTDAILMAADKFHLAYETARAYIYYYKDIINFE